MLLQTDNRRANPGLDGLGPAIDLVLIWVCALPLVGWALLRVVRARPAWAVSLTGAVLLLPVLVVFNRPGGLTFAAWQYGLEGFLAYGIAALICLPLAAALSGHGHEPSSASHELDGEQRTGRL